MLEKNSSSAKRFGLKAAFGTIACAATSLAVLMRIGLTATLLIAFGCLMAVVVYRAKRRWTRALGVILCVVIFWLGAIDLIVVRCRAGSDVRLHSQIRVLGAVLWESGIPLTDDEERLEEIRLHGLILPSLESRFHRGTIDLI